MEESRLRSLRNCLLPIYCLWVLVQGLLLALLGAIKVSHMPRAARRPPVLLEEVFSCFRDWLKR